MVLPLLNVADLVDSRSCEHTQRYYELIYARTVACLKASGISETCIPFSVPYNLLSPSSSVFLSSALEGVINDPFIAEHTQALILDTGHFILAKPSLPINSFDSNIFKPCSFHFFGMD